MEYLFENCINLKSLDLSSFITSNVENMFRMFYNCSSLVSLDLSNFNIDKVSNMDFMFYNCISLTTLNLSIFENQLSERKSFSNIFTGVNSNLIYCIVIFFKLTDI